MRCSISQPSEASSATATAVLAVHRGIQRPAARADRPRDPGLKRMDETAAGSLLVESLSSSLAARLLYRYSNSVARCCGWIIASWKTRPPASSIACLEYIHARLGDELDIRGMACAAHLSASTLHARSRLRPDRRHINTSNAKRLARAKELLVQKSTNRGRPHAH